MFEFEKKYVPDSIWKDRRRPYWLITRGSGLSLAIIFFHFVLFPIGTAVIPLESPIDFRDHLLATSIFTSAALTFALLGVYRDMGETQSDQAKTLESQEELVEIERRPWVEPCGFKPKQRFGQGGNNSDPGNVWVSNYGRGPALDIKIVTKLDFDGTDSLEPSVCVNPVRRVCRYDFARIDRSIPPETDMVKFKLSACLGFIEHGETTSKPIPHGTRLMLKEGIDEFCYQIYIQYTNLLGEVGIKPITPRKYVRLDDIFTSVYDIEQHSIRFN